MMEYGETFDMTPRNLGVDGGLYSDEEYLSIWWDNKNIYYNIEKPTEEDLRELERFELNSPKPNDIWGTSSPHQTGNEKFHQTYPYQNGGKYWLYFQRSLYNKPLTTTPIYA